MQIGTLPNVAPVEKKRYLRVATIANKTALCYFYIGTNQDSLQFLSESFHSGLVADDLKSAREAIRMNAQLIDVVIVDVPYHEKDLTGFHHFLKSVNLQAIPVIYNDCHLYNEEKLREHPLVDDIIDLCNWQYDFSSKITFLKKAKEYSLTSRQTRLRLDPPRSVAKRVFDIVIATLLIVLLLPLLLVIALAIRIESKGPVFYNAKRAGRGFRIFKFYKFRTMEVNADKKIDALAHLNQYCANSTGPKFFKISNDPRITKVGRFLRNTSLDELPQLFNVLKGDMSLVGNRPLPLYEASTLTTNEFVERFMAPAGITGLWQIKKRGRAEMSIDERIGLDISYARKYNLLYDFWIMARTPAALLQKSDV